jgi:galactonate dehydratase
VSGVPSDSVEQQIELIQGWLERGFTRFKISLGYGVEADIRHVEQLREVLGNRIDILVDAHWVYELNDAIRVARGFEALDVSFIECPLIPEDPHNYARLVQAIDLRVALGEEFRTRYAFKERLRQGSMDLAQPDFGRLGITEGWRVIQLCHAFSMPVAPHLGSGLGLYIATGLQMAAATPDLFLVEYQPTQYAASRDLFPDLPDPVDGFCPILNGPGLGLAPDEEKVRAATIPQDRTSP